MAAFPNLRHVVYAATTVGNNLLGHAPPEPPKSQLEANLEELESTADKCMHLIEALEELDGDSEEVLEKLELEWENIIKYKNREISGRLLHFAVWVAADTGDPDASAVRLLLESKADYQAPATYQGFNQKSVELEALHIAAGLGCVPALEALLKASQQPQETYLNRFCKFDGSAFYAPIHDAVFCGQREAVVWLLEHGASASLKNMDGFTPLHWLAYKSIDSENDIEVVTRSLIKHKAGLTEKTADTIRTVAFRDKIPLEMAALPGSQFPRNLMYLLAPSFQASQSAVDDGMGSMSKKATARSGPHGRSSVLTCGSKRGSARGRKVPEEPTSIMGDVALLSSYSTAAARSLTREVLHSPEDSLRHKVVFDAQDENAVDYLAGLFYLDALAAVDIVDALIYKPTVQDAGHHPLSCQARHGSASGVCQLSCTYRADVMPKKFQGQDVSWPTWLYHPEKGYPDWHNSFIRVPEEGEARQGDECDVETEVLMMPNILDLDILMALASTDKEYKCIFAKLPIRALVATLWYKVARPGYNMQLFFNIVELVVLVLWGLTSAADPMPGSRMFKTRVGDDARNSPSEVAFFWSVFISGALRDIVNTTLLIVNHFGKWKHCRKRWEDYCAMNIHGHCSEKACLQALPALWHPRKLFEDDKTMFYELLCSALRLVFLTVTMLEVNVRDDKTARAVAKRDGELSDTLQVFLAACFLAQTLKVVYMLRVTAGCGKRLLAIIATLFSGTMREMLGLTSLCFLCLLVVFVMIQPDRGISLILLDLYRGLTFGDGNGLDEMGLMHDRWDSAGGFLSTLGFFSTIMFNILLLNLIIAIYSNEYNRVETEADLLFQQARASLSFKYIMQGASGSMFSSSFSRALSQRQSEVMLLLVLALAVALPNILTGIWKEVNTFNAAAVCSFPSAIAQVCMVNVLMVQRGEWFGRHEDGREGPLENHYLWICRDARDNAHRLKKSVDPVELRLKELTDKMEAMGKKITNYSDNRVCGQNSTAASPARERSESRSPDFSAHPGFGRTVTTVSLMNTMKQQHRQTHHGSLLPPARRASKPPAQVIEEKLQKDKLTLPAAVGAIAAAAADEAGGAHRGKAPALGSQASTSRGCLTPAISQASSRGTVTFMPETISIDPLDGEETVKRPVEMTTALLRAAARRSIAAQRSESSDGSRSQARPLLERLASQLSESNAAAVRMQCSSRSSDAVVLQKASSGAEEAAGQQAHLLHNGGHYADDSLPTNYPRMQLPTVTVHQSDAGGPPATASPEPPQSPYSSLSGTPGSRSFVGGPWEFLD
eukprot:TRINITY_DN12538_c0_g1_i2.p1 TRINITY_DN12538_c0_g1~~TRINITY_DN12538_c0_g1_i2.p1  ORF type:complete len:1290 (-),score=285.14 TRINITY_DN12538_c0_g1_i2:306-4175(-)